MALSCGSQVTAADGRRLPNFEDTLKNCLTFGKAALKLNQ